MTRLSAALEKVARRLVAPSAGARGGDAHRRSASAEAALLRLRERDFDAPDHGLVARGRA